MKDRIFVSIAAYRDRELGRTLRELFSHAARPERLTVALLHQSEQPLPRVSVPRGARLIRDTCHPAESLGACWARARLQRKMDGEEFYFQIDAHHVFKRGWDELLHRELALCLADRPVLTAYLPPYDLHRSQPRHHGEAATGMQFSHFDQDGVILYRAYAYRHEVREPPLPARFFSGHFTFARREFVERVPYDPELYFFGEESTLAARAFTHGFDLFHPGCTIAWHRYGRHRRPRHWNDPHHVPDGTVPWIAMQQRGVAKYRRIFCLLPHVSPRDGLGTARTLAEYEAWAGVDHYRQLAHPATMERRRPPSAHALDWAVQEGLLGEAELALALPKLEDVDRRPCRQVHVALIDEASQDAAAFRFHPQEYTALSRAPWRVRARFSKLPLRLVVWPLLEEWVWGGKFDALVEDAAFLSGRADPARPKMPPPPEPEPRPRSRRKPRA